MKTDPLASAGKCLISAEKMTGKLSSACLRRVVRSRCQLSVA